MLNHQNKKLTSHEKDHYFRRTSPILTKLKSTFQQKNQKRIIEAQTKSPKQNSLHQSRPKQYSFMRFIPSTTKHLPQKYEQGHQNVRQTKVPSFFKKPCQNKQTTLKQLNLHTKIIKTSQFGKQNPRQVISLEQSFRTNVQTLNQSDQNTLPILQLNKYKKLNDKISYLLNKINSMKDVLDKKRQGKLRFMQTQKTQRASTICSDGDTTTSTGSQIPLKKFVTQVPQHKDLHTFTRNPYSSGNSVYYVSQILRAYLSQKSMAREHILSSMEYLRMLQQGKIPQQKEIQRLKVNLPRVKGYQQKKSIIFDLDQTLIHCNQNYHIPSDIKIKIDFPTGQIIQVGINIRPYAKQILAALSKNFEIIVFTASHSCYANVVLDHLDPQRKHIHHRLFRQSCYCTPEGVYVKDLRIINRHLSRVILVDNAAYSYAYQPLNGVPIIPYYEGKNDYQLQALQKYIESLLFSYDVRQKNKHMFKLDRYSQFYDLNRLVQTLYLGSH